MNSFNNTKGVSLTLIIGLVTLLMVTSAAASQLIIKNLRAVRGIEASNRAYLIAEGGMEDALYELSTHFAGYETPDLEGTQARSSKVEPGYYSKWAIDSKGGMNEFSGYIYKDQKLILPLYNDNSNLDLVGGLPEAVDENSINTVPPTSNDINMLNISDNFTVTISLDKKIFPTFGTLKIDNDNDFALVGVNEDGPLDFNAGCQTNPEDADCDGLVDEDSELDPVIIWTLTDGKNKTLQDNNKCMTVGQVGGLDSKICERAFTVKFATEDPFVELTKDLLGINESGVEQTISTFILDVFNNDQHAKLQFEFLIVAPMEHVVVISGSGGKKVKIPYYNYTIQSNAFAGDQIPYPDFKIKSDGFYKGFKQSITATVTPKTTVPLFDFTIIQQE